MSSTPPPRVGSAPVGPNASGARGAMHPAVRMLRNYDALSEANKRLVEALCLALRSVVDGGR